MGFICGVILTTRRALQSRHLDDGRVADMGRHRGPSAVTQGVFLLRPPKLSVRVRRDSPRKYPILFGFGYLLFVVSSIPLQ